MLDDAVEEKDDGEKVRIGMVVRFPLDNGDNDEALANGFTRSSEVTRS